MPLLDGFRVAEALRAERLPVKVIFLTVHLEESYMNKALKLGAQGYILKDAAPAEIVAGIKAVSNGQPFLSPAVTAYLVNSQGRRAGVEPPSGLTSLTPAERAVIKLIAECRTTREIADLLFISPRTVETHRTP
jgi:DNA-binding NarL/FixJ family response regulator